MTSNRFDVCVDWAGETLHVGTLYAHDRSAAVGFEYASAWLARIDAFAIDPTALPLRQGAFHALDLPGALADAGPDRWGRIVIDRSVRQGVLERRPYRAIDYLLAIEDTARIGALRLRPSGSTDFLGATRGVIPPLIRLRELLAATDAVHGDFASARDLAFLLGAGSPLGGARPKCLVSLPDGTLALAKFSKPDDVGDISGSYTRLADAIRAHGHAVTADLAELWRRLAYSILIGNVDDHMRNHGLLMRAPGQWALSPAYDINPAPIIDRAHGRQTPVSEDSPIGLGAAAEIEEAVARADRFGLRPAAARAIVGEVRAAIGRWRSIAARAGIADAALKAYADAFDAP